MERRHTKRFSSTLAPRWFAIVALLAVALSGRAQTWVQWRSDAGGNNHYYALTPSATNWAAAQTLAVAWGGTLATITSTNEQEFINATFLTGGFAQQPLWIGLVNPPAGPMTRAWQWAAAWVGRYPKVAFKWVTDEPFAYENWKPGEPNNMSPGENYVAINWEYSRDAEHGTKGNWNDTPLNGTSGYSGTTDGPYFGIVERDTDPRRPAKQKSTASVLSIGLIAVLVAFLIIFLTRRRRHTRPISKSTQSNS